MGHHVLVVSGTPVREEVLGLVSAGARGDMAADGADILRAVREVAAGNTHVSPALASFLLNSTRGVKSWSPTRSGRSSRSSRRRAGR